MIGRIFYCEICHKPKMPLASVKIHDSGQWCNCKEEEE